MPTSSLLGYGVQEKISQQRKLSADWGERGDDDGDDDDDYYR